jgi:hypothetical protein
MKYLVLVRLYPGYVRRRTAVEIGVLKKAVSYNTVGTVPIRSGRAIESAPRFKN